MRLAVAVLLVASVAAYGGGGGSNRKTGASGSGCGNGGAVCGSPGAVVHAPAGANRRVATVGGSGGTGGSGGGYWWQKNNPFVGAGNRGGNRPSGGTRPIGGNLPPAPVGGQISNQFPSGGSGFPSGQQPFVPPQGNGIVGPMGICPADYVCVHWQLCRNGQVILDGSGIIDKSKRRPAGQYANLESCGGDMVCCGVTPGYTVPGVISSLSSQQSGGAFPAVSPNDVRSPPAGNVPISSGNFGTSSFAPGIASKKPVNTGISKPFTHTSNTAASSIGNFNPPGSSGNLNQPGCAGSTSGGCRTPGVPNLNLPGSPGGSSIKPKPKKPFPHTSNTAGSTLGSYNPPVSSGNLNQPGCSGSTSGGCRTPGVPNVNHPGSSAGSFNKPKKPFTHTENTAGSTIGTYNPPSTSGNLNRPGCTGSASGGCRAPGVTNLNQPGSPGGSFNNPGSFGSGSSVGIHNQPGSPISTGGNFNRPGNSGSTGGSYKQPGNHGSSGGSFNQPGNSGGNFNKPGTFVTSGGNFNKPEGSSGGSFNQPTHGASNNQPGILGFPGGSVSQPSGGVVPHSGSYNQPGRPGSSVGSLNQPTVGSVPHGGSYNQPGTPGFPSGSLNQPGSLPTNQPGNAGFPGGLGPTGGSFNQVGNPTSSGSNTGGFNQPGSFPGSGSSFPQQNVANPSMQNMMSGMMGMNGPLIAGSCSAGTFCVPRFQCNPYNGFIIMNPNALQAVWPNAPKVPLLDCLIPAGVLDGGVCCQQAHPIVGPNGQVLD